MPNLHIPVSEAGGRPGQAKVRPKENAVYCIFILDPCLMENIPVQEHLVQYLHETHKDNTTSPSRDKFRRIEWMSAIYSKSVVSGRYTRGKKHTESASGLSVQQSYGRRLKDKFSRKEKFSHYLLTLMPTESQVKCCRPQPIWRFTAKQPSKQLKWFGTPAQSQSTEAQRHPSSSC